MADPTAAPPNSPSEAPGAFEQAFGEPLERVLDLDSWGPGEDLAALYRRLEREVGEALDVEDRMRAGVRAQILPMLADRPGAPPGAGLYRVTPGQIERVHKGLLFTGAVEACDGANAMLDTVPVTLAQIGVGLVSYQGDQGTWVQRLFRRDLRIAGEGSLEEVVALLEARTRRGGIDQERRDGLTRLAGRGLLSYAERAALVHRSTARWRVGHGVPVPLELLSGSGSRELLAASLDVLDALVLGHRRFLFVPSAPADRMLLTIGNALRPLEFAVIDTATSRLRSIADRSGSLGRDLARRVDAFVQEAGGAVALGVYRASAAAPPCLFYAHVDHIHEAALIAIADSTLQEHRGFPLLIDIAEAVCRAAFGAELFGATAQAVYAAHGAPFRYQGERQTRG